MISLLIDIHEAKYEIEQLLIYSVAKILTPSELHDYK